MTARRPPTSGPRLGSVLTVCAAVTVLTSCTTGTGEPDWNLPLTWHQDGTSVTLDEDGRAEVTDVLVGDVSCETGVPEGERVSGRAQWEWDGYASLVMTVDEHEIGVDAAY